MNKGLVIYVKTVTQRQGIDLCNQAAAMPTVSSLHPGIASSNFVTAARHTYFRGPKSRGETGMKTFLAHSFCCKL
jgi:hypothetical protein